MRLILVPFQGGKPGWGLATILGFYGFPQIKPAESTGSLDSAHGNTARAPKIGELANVPKYSKKTSEYNNAVSAIHFFSSIHLFIYSALCMYLLYTI